MSILVVDTETGGLPDFRLPADDLLQPRLCSIAAVLLNDEGNEVDCFYNLIRPDDWTPELIEKAAGAFEVNGLSMEKLMDEGVPIADALGLYEEFLEQSSIVSAYGLAFDMKMIRGALRRAGRPDHYGAKPVFCAMRAATPLCKLPPTEAMSRAGRNYHKSPKLVEAVQILLGLDLPGAHDALVDARATGKLIEWMIPQGLVVPQEQKSNR